MIEFFKLLNIETNETEADQFFRWAFGPINDRCSLIEKWNQRHSDKFQLKPGIYTVQDIHLMIQAFRKEKPSNF